MEHIRSRKGFTLVELMVVLTIIVVITMVVLASQSSFNKTLILANTAYDVALTLRSAETYGLGSRAFGSTVNAGYGVHFESGTPGSFTLFADLYPAPSISSVCHPTADPSAPSALPGNCSYEQGQGEKVMLYTLGNGIAVSDFCAYALGSWSCASANGGGLTTLDIIFARPNPEPFMSVNGSYSSTFPVTDACITLSSPQGGAQYISVGSSGRITANASSCP
ncbi:type II secretion system protein [Candidatus Kaiserbacteria bacterium]|nr:type II secretion system protein [Candidatus Kaiserbacteria bacterium]